MNEYFFLIGLGLIWIIFGVVQDLRTREVSNWLNFSLIAFSLAYRAFYAAIYHNIDFFLYGIGGVVLFVGLAYGLYYGRAFAGGDAKLLMGIGGLLPFESLRDYLFLSSAFLLLLFGLGAAYTIVYTLILITKKWSAFSRSCVLELRSNRMVWIYSIFGWLFFAVFIIYLKIYFFFFYTSLLFLAIPFLYAYVRAVEKVCMVKYVEPSRLTEGDWIVHDVHIGSHTVKKTVHGLSLKDIELLRKAKKKVLIREGVPFVPAFLLAYLSFFLFLRYFSF